MKSSPSATFTNNEEGTERRPAELFHIWRGSTHWRYTSGLNPIVYNGNTYVPGPIMRQTIQHDSDIAADTVTITCARTMPPFSEYGANMAIDSVWITIYNVFWDQSPIEASPIFSGLVEKISAQGPAYSIPCVSLEYVLHRSVPRYRYQPGCNHTIYSARCGVTEATYQITATVDSISASGFVLTLSGATFESNAAPYYLLGNLYFGDHKRMIVDHSGLTVTMRYALVTLEAGSSVIVSAGCDKLKETCRDKFDNMVHYFGFPYISFENPVLRTFSKPVY